MLIIFSLLDEQDYTRIPCQRFLSSGFEELLENRLHSMEFKEIGSKKKKHHLLKYSDFRDSLCRGGRGNYNILFFSLHSLQAFKVLSCMKVAQRKCK